MFKIPNAVGFSGFGSVAGCDKGGCLGNLGQFDSSLMENVSNDADMNDTNMAFNGAANSEYAA